MAPPEASQGRHRADARTTSGWTGPGHVQYWRPSSPRRCRVTSASRCASAARPWISSPSATAPRWSSAASPCSIVIVVALPVGVYAAVRRGTALDYAARAFAALGPGGAAVLAGPAAGARLRRPAAPAADVRSRDAAARAPARDHARLVRGGRAHAAHALVHARRARQRVRQAGAHQGAAGAHGDLEARVQERRAAGGDLRRAAVRRAAERLDHRRDGVRLAGARACW